MRIMVIIFARKTISGPEKDIFDSKMNTLGLKLRIFDPKFILFNWLIIFVKLK